MKYLILAAWAVAVVVCLASCATGERPVSPGNDGFNVAIDTAHNVACYRFVNYAGISCVRLAP